MTYEELWKLVDHEVNWLSYYGWYEDRALLTVDSDVYADVRRQGWTKRPLPLMDRCAPGLIDCDEPICVSTRLDDLRQACFPKDGNKLSPMEAYFAIFPDKKSEIIERLKPSPIVNNLFTKK